MGEEPAFKRLVLRAALRHVSPMVIRVISVSDRMDLPVFNDVFCTMLGWSTEMGYILRISWAGDQQLSAKDPIQSLARV